MKKIPYLLIAFIVSLTFVFNSCEQEEETSCLAQGTWSLSHEQYDVTQYTPTGTQVFSRCDYSCSTPQQLPTTCEYIEPANSGCVTLTITENKSYIVTDSNGWTTTGIWTGNCGVGEQVSTYWDGDVITATISSLSSSELVLNTTDGSGPSTFYFTK